MSTTFKRTSEAAAQLSGNPETARTVQNEIERNTLVAMLLTMRVSKGITQEQVAASMKCDPSKISRIESGNDSQLKWPDIAGYARALNVQMSILFDDESLPTAARIKQCVFKIDEDLQRLAHIAQKFDGNEKIGEKISRFYEEVLFNFLKRFSDNQERLTNFIKIAPEGQIAVLEEESPAEVAEHAHSEPTDTK
jgi:transcriptional regulator with XRE-family HTH domain